MRIFVLHFMTAVNARYTIDCWMHLRNTAVGDEAASEQIDEIFKITFAEDKAILEAIQEEEKRPQNKDPVRLLIDKGPNVYRKRINGAGTRCSAPASGYTKRPDAERDSLSISFLW